MAIQKLWTKKANIPLLFPTFLKKLKSQRKQVSVMIRLKNAFLNPSLTPPKCLNKVSSEAPSSKNCIFLAGLRLLNCLKKPVRAYR